MQKPICPNCKEREKHVWASGLYASYCHECNTEKQRSHYKKTRGRPIGNYVRWGKKYPKNYRLMWGRYVHNARQRGKEWSLARGRFVELLGGNCAYCGDGPTERNEGHVIIAPLTGIDRVDNNIGYIDGNVVSCCKTCNYMKRMMDEDDFLEHVAKIAEHTANVY